MSLLDLILAQKGILLTAGIALLLLMTAMILLVISRARKVAAVRAKQKAQRAAQMQNRAAVNPPEPVEQPVVNQKPVPESSVIARATPAPIPVPLSSQAAANQAPTASESQPDQPSLDGASSAMQSILSSVFGDEEATAKYDLLLKGLEPISIEHLLALSTQTAEQLHGQSGS